MKSGCRSCRRTGLFGIDGLVTGLVFKLFMDIGRKRHGAGFVQDLFPDAGKIETDDPVSIGKYVFAFCFQFSRKESHSLSRTDLLAGTGQCLPVVLIDPAEQKKLNSRSGIRSYAEKTGRDDFGIIDDQHISFMKKCGNIRKMHMRNRAGLSVQGHQP